MKVISLGVGIQSSTLLLMALHGEFESDFGMPQCAIFADTGWERKATYKYLEFLASCCDEIGFPLYVVHGGNIKQDALHAVQGIGRFATMPFYIKNADGTGAMLRRQCTQEYKIVPIYRKIKELIGDEKKQAEIWLGISWDELMRMKPAKVKWVENKWPLIERQMTRHDCSSWLLAHGYSIPPKSACIGCPFHDNTTWHNLKQTDPESWQEAIEFDKAIRYLPKLRGTCFLHPSLKKLSEVDLETLEEKGQLNLFLNECEGICGV